MTVLDSFVIFAKTLPAGRLEALEDTLSLLMQSYSADEQFSVGQLAELDRRVAEERPSFVSAADIEGLLAKKFHG